MSKVFVIDVAKCSGCQCCNTACKDEYVDNDWFPYSRPEPDVGQHWIKVEQYVNGTIPKVKIHYIPRLCNHCENPACAGVCPKEAITRHPDGWMIIEPEKCDGCGQCVGACPYGVIYLNKELSIAQKCTGCAHLLDNGFDKPRCVEACPTDALMFGEKEEMQDLIAGAVPLKPECGTMPNVFYRNIPGQWIAGTVYDEEEKEVVIGAKVFAVFGGKRYETVTDEYGDFWIKDLPVGKYDLTINASGMESVYVKEIDTKECVNLGDIPMHKK